MTEKLSTTPAKPVFSRNYEKLEPLTARKVAATSTTTATTVARTKSSALGSSNLDEIDGSAKTPFQSFKSLQQRSKTAHSATRYYTMTAHRPASNARLPEVKNDLTTRLSRLRKVNPISVTKYQNQKQQQQQLQQAQPQPQAPQPSQPPSNHQQPVQPQQQQQQQASYYKPTQTYSKHSSHISQTDTSTNNQQQQQQRQQIAPTFTYKSNLHKLSQPDLDHFNDRQQQVQQPPTYYYKPTQIHQHHQSQPDLNQPQHQCQANQSQQTQNQRLNHTDHQLKHNSQHQQPTTPYLPPQPASYQVKVNGKTYKILRKIGSGGSAKVYEGFEPTLSQTVAIKIINVGQADSRTQENYFNEKALLEKLRESQHVVKVFDSEYKSELKELVIVMEKGDADLAQVIDSSFKRLNNDVNSIFRENQILSGRMGGNDLLIDGLFIKFYWRGMVQAVNDIHNHGIVHADLKPVNFILVKNEIKLIDFGIANSVNPMDGTSIIRDYQIGTINYMAPESLRNRALDASIQQLNLDFFESKENNNNNRNGHETKRTVIKYNSKVDIWSLGCILYNLVYGRPPFEKYKDYIAKIEAITNPLHKIDFAEISNRNLLNCMISCLKYNPIERPTAKELLMDSYLREDIIISRK